MHQILAPSDISLPRELHKVMYSSGLKLPSGNFCFMCSKKNGNPFPS